MKEKSLGTQSKKSIVAFADIFGFSALVASASKSLGSSSLDEIQAKLADCCDQVKKLAERSDMHFYAISDCFFLVKAIPEIYAESVASLKKAHDTIGESITIFSDRGFILRGGIAVGEVKCTDANVLLGLPVVRAVRIEQSFRAPLVLLPESEALQLERIIVNAAIKWPSVVVPTKQSGRLSAYVFGPRDTNHLVSVLDEMREKRDDHYRKGPPEVALAYEEAVEALEKLNIEKEK